MCIRDSGSVLRRFADLQEGKISAALLALLAHFIVERFAPDEVHMADLRGTLLALVAICKSQGVEIHYGEMDPGEEAGIEQAILTYLQSSTEQNG